MLKKLFKNNYLILKVLTNNAKQFKVLLLNRKT